MQLSPPALAELQWWRDNAQTLKRDIQHAHPSTSIQSDASTLGWGAVFGTQKTGGGGEMDPFGSRIPYKHIGITCSLFCVKVFL